MGGRRPRINTLPWDSDCGMARAIGALGRPHRVQPAPILVSCTAALVATTGIHGWSSAYSGIQLIALGDSIHSCGRREPFAKPALQRLIGRPHKEPSDSLLRSRPHNSLLEGLTKTPSGAGKQSLLGSVLHGGQSCTNRQSWRPKK